MTSLGNEYIFEIDTNIYSYPIHGDADAISTLQQVTNIGIFAISIGELLSGFKAGNKKSISRNSINSWIRSGWRSMA